jgi:type III secretion protein J
MGGAMRTLGTAVLAFALLGNLAGCAVPIAAGLDEPDANKVVVALDQVGVDATKDADPQVEGKFRVSVPRDDAARALATMADEQLPRPRARGLLDATDKGALVPSQAAEHAALVAGLGGELERSLGGVDGVLSARVHLNLPARDALRDGPPPRSTASVLLEHRGATPPIGLEAIQRLVSGGAPALAVADVAVVFVPHPARASGVRSDLAHVGPITVARGSLTTLKVALGGLVLVVIGLAAATLALWTRLARVQRIAEAANAPSATPTPAPRTAPGPAAGGVPSARPPGYGP